MNEMTWLSIGILGPGAVGVFLWFLKDVKGLPNVLANQERKQSIMIRALNVVMFKYKQIQRKKLESS